jgi:hypothetical protein
MFQTTNQYICSMCNYIYITVYVCHMYIVSCVYIYNIYILISLSHMHIYIYISVESMFAQTQDSNLYSLSLSILGIG